MTTRFNINLSLEELSEVKDIDSNVVTLSDINADINENSINIKNDNELVDTLASLESIANVISSSLEYGGLNKTTVQVTNIALQSFYKRIPSLQKDSISIEGFKSPEDCVKNTRLALESIIDKIKSILKVIISSIKHSIEWLQKFIRHTFNKFEEQKDQIKNLRVSLIKTTKDTFVDKKFDNVNIINNLKAGSIVNIADNISNLNKFIKDFFKHNNTEGLTVVSNTSSIIHAISTGNTDTVVKNIFDVKSCSEMVLGKAIENEPKSSNLLTFVNAELLAGDLQVVAFLPKVTTNNLEFDDRIKDSEILITVIAAEQSKISEINFLSKGDIEKLLHGLEELCNEGMRNKKECDTFIDVKLTLVKDLERVVTAYTTNVTEADKGTYIGPVSARLRLLDNVYINGCVNLTKHVNKVLASGITYAEDCINSYM